MQEETIDRVRKDLATINAVIGKELPFGAADVWMYGLIAAASGVFAVCHALGAQRGWLLFLSGLPVIVAFTSYLGYLVAKSRHTSQVNLTRRKEYRTTLLILLPVVLAALAGKFWAASAGMSHLQFGGSLLVVLGFVFVMVSLVSSRTTRYPRSYWVAGGMPLIASGAWIPFCTQTQALFVAGCMGGTLFGLLATVMHCHLRRQERGTCDATD